MVSRLPDNGQKIQMQIAELSAELHRIKMKKENKTEVIELDSLTGEFNKVLMNKENITEVIDLDSLTREFNNVLNV